MQGDLLAFGVFLQIHLAFHVALALEDFDRAISKTFAVIRDDQIIVDINNAAKAPATFTSADWRVKGKHARGW